MNSINSFQDEILVVDDTPSGLKLLENILTGAGYRVRLATDGELAIRSVNIRLPSLILLDIKMPNMDGYEVCQRLKDNEKSRSVPIIFISALEDEREKVKAFQVGGIDYINKPINAAEVLARVNTHLTLRHAQIDMETRNLELEAFAYSVAHDLRAPLRAIDGFSLALLEDYQNRLDEQGINYLQRVRAASQRMGQLIDDLLDLSFVSRCEINIQQVNLSQIAKEISNNLHETHPDRQVEFIIQEEVKVSGDLSLLRIVMENLIGNAWKFTSKHATAKIEFGVSRQEEKEVYFIRDNGAGFDMNYQNKLFTAFQRLHTTAEFPGSGIGLATIQRIINRHNGRVWAEGEIEKGAVFYFTIP